MIATSNDGKLVGYKGRVYIELPQELAGEDAVVIHKRRLPHLGDATYDLLVEAHKRIAELEAVVATQAKMIQALRDCEAAEAARSK